MRESLIIPGFFRKNDCGKKVKTREKRGKPGKENQEKAGKKDLHSCKAAFRFPIISYFLIFSIKKQGKHAIWRQEIWENLCFPQNPQLGYPGAVDKKIQALSGFYETWKKVMPK